MVGRVYGLEHQSDSTNGIPAMVFEISSTQSLFVANFHEVFFLNSIVGRIVIFFESLIPEKALYCDNMGENDI